MGLLEPTSGKIYIDNNELFQNENKKLIESWRSSIVHVPQSIYLTDNSIAENIAFGISKEKIDYKKIEFASKKAQIFKFVNSLPDGFNTIVGENGVLLSGGQKQRIGIARALYRKVFDVLILDEATSALDYDTEEKIINSIQNMKRQITIIMIAHRKNTLNRCNRIFELKGNKLFINTL